MNNLAYKQFKEDIDAWYDDLMYSNEIADIARQHGLDDLANAFQNGRMLRYFKSDIFNQMMKWGFSVIEKEAITNLKLYIAVLDEFPDYMVPTLVAHSMLSAHLQFQAELYYQLWLKDSFKKVVVRVNQREFDKISAMSMVYLGHENKTLDGKKSCAVVCPMNPEAIPNVLKFAKMWKPKQEYRAGCKECESVQVTSESNRQWHEDIAKGREIVKQLAGKQ